jgi:GNAT superfamily N-acetyltransferase
MLFEGFSLHLTAAPDNVAGHPFHAANNVNGIGIASIDDYQVLPLDPHVQALQEAYIRKVVDTVQDLPNVLYEVANESSGGGSVAPPFAARLQLGDATGWGDSTTWQYEVIAFLKRYEAERGYQRHPVGMTIPAYRGHGYGRAVVSAMTTYGLTHVPVVRYGTLRAHVPALRIAPALGYQEYGLTLAVRLAD